MALVRCKECGTRISDKASRCTYCGYDVSLSEVLEDRKNIEIIQFEDDILEIFNQEVDLNNYKESMLEIFGDFENIKNYLPSFYLAIKELSKTEKILVADLDSYYNNLLEKGLIKFGKDKFGKILPSLYGKDGKIFKQVRLEYKNIPKNFETSLISFSINFMMNEILEEISIINNKLDNIQNSFKEQRYYLAESNIIKLTNIRKMQDSRLREISVLNLLDSIEYSKISSQKILNSNIKLLYRQYYKKTLKIDEIEKITKDTFVTLNHLSKLIYIQCNAYNILEEYEISVDILHEFNEYIQYNKLSSRDTLLMIGELADSDYRQEINEFSIMSNKIDSFLQNESFLMNNVEFYLEGETYGKQ